MADPFSVAAAALSLAVTIGHTTLAITKFVRLVRDARGDMDALLRELHSLQLALQMLAEGEDEEGSVQAPPVLKEILDECTNAISVLDAELQKYTSDCLKNKVKFAWSGKQTMSDMQRTIAGHQRAVVLAVDTITLSLTRQVYSKTNEILARTDYQTDQILQEIGNLRIDLANVHPHLRANQNPMLLRYLEEVASYAETVIADDDDEDARDCESEEGERYDGSWMIRQWKPVPASPRPVSPASSMGTVLIAEEDVSHTSGIPEHIDINPTGNLDNIGLETIGRRMCREKVSKRIEWLQSAMASNIISTPLAAMWEQLEGGSDTLDFHSSTLRPERFAVCRELTMSGAHVSQVLLGYPLPGKPRESTTPLHIALALRDRPWVEYLLKSKIDFAAIGSARLCTTEAHGHHSHVSLCELALDWNLAMLRLLVEHGAQPIDSVLSSVCATPWTEMYELRRKEHCEQLLEHITKFCIERGAKPNQLDLLRPLNQHYYKIVKLWCAHGTPPDVAISSSKFYGSLVQRMIYDGRFDDAKALIETGADLDRVWTWRKNRVHTKSMSVREFAKKYDTRGVLGTIIESSPT